MRILVCWGIVLAIGLIQFDEPLFAQQAHSPITETRVLKSLSSDEASRGLPVQIEGMILYCAAYNVSHCMLRDQFGAVLIKAPVIPLEPGMIVEVTGYTVYESHTKVDSGAKIQVIGKAPVPEP